MKSYQWCEHLHKHLRFTARVAGLIRPFPVLSGFSTRLKQRSSASLIYLNSALRAQICAALDPINAYKKARLKAGLF